MRTADGEGMKHLDLFSGIGGFSLACDWLDIETICFCEIDKFCQKVLKKHWPDVEIVEDVNNVEEIKRIVEEAIWRESVQNVNNQRLPQGKPTADLAKRRKTQSGESKIENIIARCKGTGANERSMKSSTTMEASVSVAENQEKSFSPLTTKRTTEMQREENTNHKLGNSLGLGDFQMTTKSSATTVTTQGQTMESVPIKRNENEQVIANSRQQSPRGESQPESTPSNPSRCDNSENRGGESLLLTAGFPCQPFSAAGRRRGAEDNRYFWPQTLAVIEAVKPDWVLLENVAGLLSMVFPDSAVGVASQASLFNVPNDEIADYDTIAGRIDGDLRQAGYETVWLVIPACAINAPHRRDRVWIVANAINSEHRGGRGQIQEEDSIQAKCGQTLGGRLPCRTGCDVANATLRRCERRGQEQMGSSRQLADGITGEDSHAADTSNEGLQGSESRKPLRFLGQPDRSRSYQKPDWSEDWYEVAARFCGIYDGVPNRVDRLKSLGNSIVPQVAYQMIKAIVGTGSVLPL